MGGLWYRHLEGCHIGSPVCHHRGIPAPGPIHAAIAAPCSSPQLLGGKAQLTDPPNLSTMYKGGPHQQQVKSLGRAGCNSWLVMEAKTWVSANHLKSPAPNVPQPRSGGS